MDAQASALIDDNDVGDKKSLKRRLGRGLNALLGAAGDEEHGEFSSLPPGQMQPADHPQLQIHQPTVDKSSVDGAAESAETPPSDEVAIELIERNPFQPRREFEEEPLKELADSIRQHGVLQPLLVRAHGDGYQLIAGERRWRAAQQAGLETVPCRVLQLEDRAVCEVAIEENLKRCDLNVLEKAQAFQEYLDRFGTTIEDLAKQLSMNRSTVSNMLRLLELPEPVRNALTANQISAGHARALLPLVEEKQIELCERIAKENLSVRKAEKLVRELLNPDAQQPAETPASTKEPTAAPEMSSHVQSVQDQLREQFGVKVEIRLKTNDTGKIILHFGSNDDFERIIRTANKAA